MALALAAAFLFVSRGAPPASACPGEPRTEAGALLAEKRWVEALQKRDAAALDCILDQSFADTSWQGELILKSQGARVVDSVRFVDVFVYRSERWQAVSAQESLVGRR
jgi:hypothetical protein